MFVYSSLFKEKIGWKKFIEGLILKSLINCRDQENFILLFEQNPNENNEIEMKSLSEQSPEHFFNQIYSMISFEVCLKTKLMKFRDEAEYRRIF